jgi:hypothetical protein
VIVVTLQYISVQTQAEALHPALQQAQKLQPIVIITENIPSLIAPLCLVAPPGLPVDSQRACRNREETSTTAEASSPLYNGKTWLRFLHEALSRNTCYHWH